MRSIRSRGSKLAAQRLSQKAIQKPELDWTSCITAEVLFNVFRRGEPSCRNLLSLHLADKVLKFDHQHGNSI